MSNFAPIAPVHLFRRLPQVCNFGTYHLLLAHQVLQDQQEWELAIQEVRARATEAQPATIILDNSLIELGEALSADKLFQAAQIVGADYVVMPDVLNDREKTIRDSTLGLRQIREFDDASFKCAIVAQGQIEVEYLQCVAQVLEEASPGQVGLICVPKAATKNLTSRRKLTSLLWNTFQIPIHLLGWSDIPLDDVYACRQEGVLGIDSAVPIWYGAAGLMLPQGPPPGLETGPRPKHFWGLPTINANYMAYNVNIAQAWFGDVK